MTGDPGLFQEALDDTQARMDDIYWARFVTRPFTWQRFADWWAARRYVVPRDVRKT